MVSCRAPECTNHADKNPNRIKLVTLICYYNYIASYSEPGTLFSIHSIHIKIIIFNIFIYKIIYIYIKLYIYI